MSTVIQEYNFDAYIRKYERTLSMVNINGQNVLKYIDTVAFDGEGDVVFQDSSGNKFPANPVYHHFKSGYYSYGPNKWLCITRRPAQSFKIGLSVDGHKIKCFDNGWINWVASYSKIQPYTKINAQESINLREGPISDRFFIGAGKIYYLTTPIGFIQDHMFVLADKALTQEVADLLRGLYFKGIPCLVHNM